jgi:hypothetical protein
LGNQALLFILSSMKKENQVFSIMPIMLIMIVLIYSTLIFLLYNKMNHELKSVKHENKQLKNEVQLREDEISYWGMKYDSLAYEKK